MNLKFWKTDPHADAEGLIQKSLDMPLSATEQAYVKAMGPYTP